MTTESLFSTALWLAAAGHFCTMAAGLQIPSRLKWKEELAKLHPFNRKLMWTYGIFVLLVIIGFGTLTAVLHDEMLRGDRSALALAAFIGLFWTIRIGFDLFYHSHKDWPEGARFVVGHAALTTLFIALIATYGGLVAWHVWIR